jgi:hypothetical protein
VRAGRGMSRLTRLAAPRRPEEAILGAPVRDAAVTAAVLALTALAFAAVADRGVLVRIQRVDDAWLRLMVSGRSAPVTVIAKFFNLLGLVYVTLPVRIAIAALAGAPAGRDQGSGPRTRRARPGGPTGHERASNRRRHGAARLVLPAPAAPHGLRVTA